jgi:hypothetical protein
MLSAIRRASQLLLRPSYCYKTCEEGKNSMNKIDIINKNMKFITEKTDLYVIPHHPTLFIKDNSIEVNTDSNVVEFSFV